MERNIVFYDEGFKRIVSNKLRVLLGKRCAGMGFETRNFLLWGSEADPEPQVVWNLGGLPAEPWILRGRGDLQNFGQINPS